MKKRTVNVLRNGKGSILTFVIATFFFLFISDENILQTFTPRRMCMFNNTKLISIHFLSDIIIGIAYISIGIGLYKIYKVFNGLKLPWKGFLWMFGGFIFLCGLTHFISVINLWVTFYWVDGLMKMLTAVFSAGVAITLRSDYNKIKEMKVDFNIMAEKLSAIIREAEEKYTKIANTQFNYDDFNRNTERNRGE